MLTNELIKLLLCPACKNGELIRDAIGDLNCKSDLCKRKYTSLQSYPVLVDFDNSIFNLADYETSKFITSFPKRTKTLEKKSIKQKILGTNHIAKNNLSFLLACLPLKSRILVIGGGTIGAGAEDLYVTSNYEVISFDVYPSELIDFIADAHSVPFRSETFDAVWIQAVIEHVLIPEVVVDEIWRVLKPSGYVYCETPFLQSVHEGAYDFTRYTPLGHRWLFRKFTTMREGLVDGPGKALFWAIRAVLRGICRNNKLGNYLSVLFFWVRFIDCLIPKKFALDAACGVYFLGQKSTEFIKIKDIISNYNGAQ